MEAETSSTPRSSRPITALYAAAAFVVVVAGLRAAADIITPVLLAGFVAIVFAPALLRLRGWKIPTLLALPLLSAPVIIAAAMLLLLIESSFATLQKNMNIYQRRLEARKQEVLDDLRGLGAKIPADVSFGEFDPRQIGRWTSQFIAMLRSVVTSAALVLLLLLMLLLEATGLTQKLRALPFDSVDLLERCQSILENIRYYLLLKTAISALTGVLVVGLLWLAKVDFPFLWGFVAFALNYIPNIGSILAAIPPMLLAYVMNGPTAASLVAIGFLTINAVVGSILEPLWMGRGVGLSPLVVLLSLLFWGWILGPIGMLLSVPLSMTCKIVLEADESTRWIAVLLGPNIVPSPPPGNGPAVA